MKNYHSLDKSSVIKVVSTKARKSSARKFARKLFAAVELEARAAHSLQIQRIAERERALFFRWLI